jgi:hypothetical protein
MILKSDKRSCLVFLAICWEGEKTLHPCKELGHNFGFNLGSFVGDSPKLTKLSRLHILSKLLDHIQQWFFGWWISTILWNSFEEWFITCKMCFSKNNLPLLPNRFKIKNNILIYVTQLHHCSWFVWTYHLG